jgi:hypothetical protein
VIRDLQNGKNLPSITSDHWHVVRATLADATTPKPRFVRSIVSEHEDRGAAVAAARKIVRSVTESMGDRPRDVRDQVFVRRPDFKSLKTAKRVARRGD